MCLQALDHALGDGGLRIPEPVGRPRLRQAAKKPFVVYAKAPMAGPAQVLRYLGRYTHRIVMAASAWSPTATEPGNLGGMA